LSSVTEIMNKFKQLPQARISAVVVVLLLIYIASILADITWRLMPAPEQGKGLNRTGVPSSSQANNREPRVDIRQLNGLNIFGQYVAVKQKETVVEQPQNDEPLEVTRLNLSLSATVAEGDNSGKGTAIIGSAGKQGTYGLGEKIDSTTAILKEVYSDRVIVQNGRKDEILMLDGVEYDNRNRPISNDESAKKETDQAVVSQSRDGFRRDSKGRLMMPGQKKGDKQRIGQDNGRQSKLKSDRKVDNRRDEKLRRELSKQRAELAKDPKKLFELIRFSPKRDQGRLVGYLLNPGAQPQLFRQAGFRPGDLAVEVNGYQLNDMQQAMTALKELRTMTEANIVVQRKGEFTEILFSLDAANRGSGGGMKKSQPKRGPTQVKLN